MVAEVHVDGKMEYVDVGKCVHARIVFNLLIFRCGLHVRVLASHTCTNASQIGA